MATSSRLYGSIEAAKEIGISLRQLYHWVDSLRVVTPKRYPYGMRKFRRFTEKDILTLRKMKEIVDWGYTLTAAVNMLKEQQSTSDGTANHE
ncbi:MAG: hypothetical protein A3C35_03230 [Omnitrophica bacterium RIFCSPHIGHO2_02_FULL_46_11]|nr:MAG: hypothetical protein A3C35_03230 [Omnitrophica bacterium RIFCSPHIGHO2_02_FULL_46_11]OGW87545.1 MAG: hypothetical protein A3A81_03235 [Omnitrophica bacterium RIFCSPLOWO2_01_FULL_45_10b]